MDIIVILRVKNNLKLKFSTISQGQKYIDCVDDNIENNSYLSHHLY